MLLTPFFTKYQFSPCFVTAFPNRAVACGLWQGPVALGAFGFGLRLCGSGLVDLRLVDSWPGLIWPQIWPRPPPTQEPY